jgi:hypothetical protein
MVIEVDELDGNWWACCLGKPLWFACVQWLTRRGAERSLAGFVLMGPGRDARDDAGSGWRGACGEGEAQRWDGTRAGGWGWVLRGEYERGVAGAGKCLRRGDAGAGGRAGA